MKDTAKLIAMVVRNAMEDFHVKHLTDEQMKELNPIIRNAIYTTLRAMSNADKEESRKFMRYHIEMIPDYWEEPIDTRNS